MESKLQTASTHLCLSRLEALLITFTIMATSGFICWLSFTGAHDQILSSQIAFAGTITSIVLAVIAIVYAFYQADAQQRGSHSITNEIASLHAVGKGVDAAAAQIASGVNDLKRVEAELTASVQLLGERLEHRFQSMEQVMKEFQQEPTAPEKLTHAPLLKTDGLSKFVDGLISSDLVRVLALSHASKNKLTLAVGWDIFWKALQLSPTYVKLKQAEQALEQVQYKQAGMYQEASNMLRALGLVKFNEIQAIVLNAELITLVEARAKELDSGIFVPVVRFYLPEDPLSA